MLKLVYQYGHWLQSWSPYSYMNWLSTRELKAPQYHSKFVWHSMSACVVLNYLMKPVVNPMLGPSSSALINLGARFPPCMKLVTDVPPSTPFACEQSVQRCLKPRITDFSHLFLGLNDTANPPDQICPLETICGFGGKHMVSSLASNLTFRRFPREESKPVVSVSLEILFLYSHLTYHSRFITPIFLHAGFVHILLNMLAQLTLSAQVRYFKPSLC